MAGLGLLLVSVVMTVANPVSASGAIACCLEYSHCCEFGAALLTFRFSCLFLFFPVGEAEFQCVPVSIHVFD